MEDYGLSDRQSLESFAAHGLHGIPEDRLHMSDFYEHARSEPAKHLVSITRQFVIRAKFVRAGLGGKA
jgi:hypothetical protein